LPICTNGMAHSLSLLAALYVSASASTKRYLSCEVFELLDFPQPHLAFYIACTKECADSYANELAQARLEDARLRETPRLLWDTLPQHVRTKLQRTHEQQELGTLPGVKEQLNKLSATSMVVQVLHKMLYGEYCEPATTKDRLLSWRGLDPASVSTVELARLYRQIRSSVRAGALAAFEPDR